MNFKNLAMWAIIVVLTIGLYNMFKNPQNVKTTNNEKIIFSLFVDLIFCGFLNILYNPIVKTTIIAHIARFLKFIIDLKLRIILY